jgi:hypothetical protein
MVDEFATVGGIQTVPHLLEKPLIIVHEALYSLLHKGRRIAATLGGKPVKPSLQVGTKIYIQCLKSKGRNASCQARAPLSDATRGGPPRSLDPADDHTPKLSGSD